jgi:two-component sensor histidine kinase
MDSQRLQDGVATLLQGLSDAALSASADGQILWLNDRARMLFGASLAAARPTLAHLEEAVQFAALDGRPLEAAERPFTRALAGQPVSDQRCLLVLAGGQGLGLSQPVAVTAVRSAEAGVLWLVLRLLAPASLEAALHREVERRGLLLREMNHRIRNHLQLLAALVGMQGAAVADAAARSAVENSVKRIRALAALHGELYDREGSGRIDLARLLQRLAAEFCSGLLHETQQRIETALEPVETNGGQGLALALIATELLTNAIKHGRPKAGAGVVWLSLRRCGMDAELAVSDDGPGCGPGATDGRLGTRLVAALAQQIGARLERSDLHPGCRVTLSFVPDGVEAAGKAA